MGVLPVTDSRLPGNWLTDIRYADLSDRAWRVFTGALMWSNEQGTDGIVPARYLRLLHPDGDVDEALDELEKAGIVHRPNGGGILLPRWSDRDGLGQSTAEQVRNYRENARERQRRHRESTRSVTRDSQRDVARDVGKGISNKRSSAYVTRDVTRDPAPLVTVKPGSDCGDGNHRRLADGTCLKCDNRSEVA